MLLKLSLSLLRLFPTGAIYAPQVQGPGHSRRNSPLRAATTARSQPPQLQYSTHSRAAPFFG